MITINKTLERLHPDQPFEVSIKTRSIKKCGAWEGWAANMASGWFDDPIKAAKYVQLAEEQAMPEGIYVTMNPTAPVLLARANNRLKGGVPRTSDKDIPRLTRLLIDVDPVRPTGISASNSELEEAKTLARRIYDYLLEQGWPKPITALSGNGYHLVSDIDLPPEDSTLIKQILALLGDRFDTESVKVDRKVFNPSRLIKIWGTVARKGDPINDRPHRQSEVCQWSSGEIVSREQLVSLVESLDREKDDIDENEHTSFLGLSSPRLDVPGYLADHGIEIAGEKELDGGAKLFILKHCLFDRTHKGKEAAIGQQPHGTLFYQCFHDSCREYTWKDARETISGKDKLSKWMSAGSPKEPLKLCSYEISAVRVKFSERIESVLDPTSDGLEELTVNILRDIAESNLPNAVTEGLLKLIAKKVKVPITVLRKDLRSFNHIETKKGELHLQAAREVVNYYGKDKIVFSHAFFWVWDNVQKGVWRKVDDRKIKKTIHKKVEKFNLTKSVVDSILDLVKTESYFEGHQFDLDTRSINVRNGELVWSDGEWMLQPHQRQNYRTTQLPIVHDPNAKAPRFEQFLIEVFRDDLDRDSKAMLVCELLGYSLLTSCEYEKFGMLIGPGANGKSVLMDLLAALVGYDHVAGVQPHQFDNRFQRAHLYGKLVNLVTEIPEGHIIEDAQLKAITSGELTTAEHKHKPPFNFNPFCTCWFGTNHMPHTRDLSDALFRRAIILTFHRVFSEKEQDRKLKEKLKAELPGILNMALDALKDVFIRGEFTEPVSCRDAKAEWRREADQVAQFAEDCCNFKPGARVSSKEAYQAYRTWAFNAGIRYNLNRKNFSTRMVRLGASLGKGTGGVRLLNGVSIVA